jgi:hypothetical protein
MLTHPDQLEMVHGGQRTWSEVIEETLRWQAPIPYLPLRYAIEDIELDGITELSLAVAPGELMPSRSFLSNGHTTLPANRRAPARSAMDQV